MPSKENPTAIERLIQGYEYFYQQYFSSDKSSLYKELVEKGQAPKIMVIACSDSRVDPALILNAAPGEIFIVRNVANLVPPCENDHKHHGTSAALQFAVCYLKVEHVIVLGHSLCGGIRALLHDSKEIDLQQEQGFIASWMEIAKNAKEQALRQHTAPAEQEQYCCKYSLMASIDNLHTFPWIKSKVEAGTLHLHAWHFDLETGRLRSLDRVQQVFVDLEAGINHPF